MPDTNQPQPPAPVPDTALPKWLAAAEAEHARREKTFAAHMARIADEMADRINSKLDELGITTPIRPAAVSDTLVNPALLVEADPEEELYSVYAAWDATEKTAHLTVGHFWNEYSGQLPSRPLNTVDDVVLARHEGPRQTPEPQRSGPATWDLRKIAEDAARMIPSDVTSHDAGEIAQLLSGLAAAVLCLADSVTAVNDRP